MHKKAAYDREQIAAILDEALVAHLGFAHEGQPFVIPTLHARVGDQVYVHGSAACRTMRALGGARADVPDGDAARRARVRAHVVRAERELSQRGRSWARPGSWTDPDEKLLALERFMEHVLPGPLGSAARCPNRQELKGDDGARAPARRGVGEDLRRRPGRRASAPDGDTPVWAGHVPLTLAAGAPVACEHLAPGIPLPADIAGYTRERRSHEGERRAA